MDRIIRFATIGSNVIVDSFLSGAAHDSRFRLDAVYSRTAERGIEFAQKHSCGRKVVLEEDLDGGNAGSGSDVIRVFTSLEALAADTGIDAVYIATPNICHAPQAILMMDHGKHVLCEKPMAPSVAEVSEMISASRRNGVVLMEAMKSTLLPNFFAIREALSKIGPVRRYFAQFCQYSSRYDKFLSGEVANAFNPKMKGGALLDLGVYGIAPMVHLFGMPSEVHKSEVRMVPGGEKGAAGHCVSGAFEDTSIDVQGTLTVTYPDMEGVIMYSKISDSSMPVEIQGEKGRILIRKLSQMTSPYIEYRGASARKPGEPMLGYDQVRTEDISVETIPENMYYELREFIDVILSGGKESEENTLQRTLQVIEICEGLKK